MIIIYLSLLIIFILFLCPRNILKSISSKRLHHKTIWISQPHQYNPSITSNHVVAIRKSHQSLYNWYDTILTSFYMKPYSNILLYHTHLSKMISLDLNLEDPRIIYYQETYYIIAVKYQHPEIIPHLITLSSDFKIIRVKAFDMSPFPTPYRQKNWNFFITPTHELLLITDIYPEFIIRSVNMDTLETTILVKHNTTNFFPASNGFLRCSTTFIPWINNTLLGALHVKHQLTIRTLFCTIQDHYPYQLVSYTPVYHVQNKLIEFISGLTWNSTKTRLVCSFGIEDYQGIVIEVDPNELEFITP